MANRKELSGENKVYCGLALIFSLCKNVKLI